MKSSLLLLSAVSGIKVEQQGVPVYVHPILLENEAADIDLRQRDIILDGVNGYEFTQLDSQPDESVVLQVRGVPVYVNPESMMFQPTDNQMQSAPLGFPLVIGPDDVSVLQTKAKNPVNNPPFNNWSVNQPSVPHDKGMKGGEDIELRNLVIDGVNGYDI